MSERTRPVDGTHRPVRVSTGTMLIYEDPATAGTAARVGAIAGSDWRQIVTEDVERFRWLAAVRKFRVIVVCGASVGTCRKALDALPAEDGPPVVGLVPRLAGAQAWLLDAGADQVLDIDCDSGLLRSVMHAVMRRTRVSVPELRYLHADGLQVDVWSREVLVAGCPVPLTPTEFDLLQLLMTRAQTVVAHHEIIKAVWNWKYADERNALRLQVNRLCHKLGDRAGQRRLIRSVRGVGYIFAEPVSQFAGDDGRQGGDSEPKGTDAMLHTTLRQLNELLISSATCTQACRRLVTTVVANGICDASAVFAREPKSDTLHLLAQAGNSQEWLDSVAAGVPLAGPYMASDTVNNQRALHVVDLASKAKKFSATSRLLRPANLSSHLSVPLGNRGAVWGQIGFGRRSDSAFTAAYCTVLEAAAYLLGAQYAGGPAQGIDAVS